MLHGGCRPYPHHQGEPTFQLVARTLPLSPRPASSCFSTCTKIVQLLFLPVRTNIHKFTAARTVFQNPVQNPQKIYTSREDWMGRCPKKLQGGSRKSAVQKVLILPLRSSRRRRARPSPRSRRSQNRSRRRTPPPPRRRCPPLRLRRRPPRQLLTLQLFVDTCPDFVTRKNYTHRFSPLSFSFGRKRLKTFGVNSGRYPMYLARLLLSHF